MAKDLTCEVPLCGKPLTEGTGSKGGEMICDACRSSKYYWRKQGQGAIVERARKLQFWQERVSYLAPIIARNVKRVQAQLADLREETERSTAEILRQAKARTRNRDDNDNVH